MTAPAPTVARERIARHLGLSPHATDQAIIAAARERYPDLPPPQLAARLGHVAYPAPRRDSSGAVVAFGLLGLVLVVFTVLAVVTNVVVAVAVSVAGLVWAGRTVRPRRPVVVSPRSSSKEVVRR